MLLAVDIGNTSIKFGLFDGDTLTSKFSIPTKRDASSGEISSAIGDRLSGALDAAIVCSVVPSVNEPVSQLLPELTGCEPVFVDNSFDFGFNINYEPLDSLGTDRLVNAFGAIEKYGAPVIVCSLGTATTIDVVSAEREFLGGLIAPGVDVMAEALHGKAPRLPTVDVQKPESLIASSTPGSIQSGLYYGYVAMVEGLITRIRSESGVSRIIGTGGNAVRIADEFAGMMTVDEDLLLEGLRRLIPSTH